MKDIKALQTLIRVRERVADRLEQELVCRRERARECEQRLDQARAQNACAREAEAAARQNRLALISSSFTPAALRTLDFAIESCVVATAAAAKLVGSAEAAHLEAQSAVAEVQKAQHRNRQRMDRFKERIASALSERERAAEEALDEESEEAAASRQVARTRRCGEELSGE
jgi:hypothetical protein